MLRTPPPQAELTLKPLKVADKEVTYTPRPTKKETAAMPATPKSPGTEIGKPSADGTSGKEPTTAPTANPGPVREQSARAPKKSPSRSRKAKPVLPIDNEVDDDWEEFSSDDWGGDEEVAAPPKPGVPAVGVRKPEARRETRRVHMEV